jgi:hypothetical protein
MPTPICLHCQWMVVVPGRVEGGIGTLPGWGTNFLMFISEEHLWSRDLIEPGSRVLCHGFKKTAPGTEVYRS